MPGGAPTAHLRVSDALTLLREQNLTDCLNADVLDYAAFDQITAQTLQRPTRIVQPQQARVRVGDVADAQPLIFRKHRRSARRFPAAEAVQPHVIEPMNPFANIDRVQVHLFADLRHALTRR